LTSGSLDSGFTPGSGAGPELVQVVIWLFNFRAVHTRASGRMPGRVGLRVHLRRCQCAPWGGPDSRL